MKYKVGDRVRIKSLDWYNENKDNYGSIYAGNGFCFWKNMARLCGEIMKITSVKVDPEDSNKGYYFMENSEEKWTDEMIEGLVEEEMSLDKAGQTTDFEYEGLAYTLPEGYQFVDENGNVINATKIVLEKKKQEYPKSYEECCEILDVCSGETLQYGDLTLSNDYEFNLYMRLENFRKLLICRDAYWKIAGEEMGLGKPWEPSGNEDCFVVSRSCGEVYLYSSAGDCEPFEFPTAKMRDAFYENFKEEIEICKELL